MMKNNMMSKVYRTFTGFLPVSNNRTGKCVECGECCRLPFKCPFLREKNGKSKCIIYKFRPLNCRKYPRTAKEHITKETCGFRFK
jgi:hypothetical protein